jgi:molybdate transport system ATP-binding protein
VSEPGLLDVQLVHRVHQSLVLDIALQLPCECGVLFGASGAGKTTLLRLIAGLITPGTGRIQLGSMVLFESKTDRHCPLRLRQVGMVFQEDLLFPHLDVAANIRFGLKGQPRSQVEARLAEVAALCGVEGLLARRPDGLSGGERQRVGLARALAPRPRILLCDEPVSALDIENRYALIERLSIVQRALAIPVLFVTHNPAEAVALASRLFYLSGGKIVDQGAPLDVLARQTMYSEASTILGDVRNTFRATVEGHTDDGGATVLQLVDGPTLLVPFYKAPKDTPVSVSVRAEEVLLATGTIEGLSARNLMRGSVERMIPHGREAEVLVRTGGIVWIASVVAPAITALNLAAGTSVHLIIKARSCHVRPASE